MTSCLILSSAVCRTKQSAQGRTAKEHSEALKSGSADNGGLTFCFSGRETKTETAIIVNNATSGKSTEWIYRGDIEVTALDELIIYIERQAQLDALRRAAYELFPYSERGEAISKECAEERLRKLIEKVDNGERL